jgi:hypothetical protein
MIGPVYFGAGAAAEPDCAMINVSSARYLINQPFLRQIFINRFVRAVPAPRVLKMAERLRLWRQSSTGRPWP